MLVGTGAVGLVLPAAWKERLGEVCGPVRIQIEGFDAIFNEAIFMDMHPQDGLYEPLLGCVILEQSGAAVDLVGHRLVR